MSAAHRAREVAVVHMPLHAALAEHLGVDRHTARAERRGFHRPEFTLVYRSAAHGLRHDLRTEPRHRRARLGTLDGQKRHVEADLALTEIEHRALELRRT